MNKSNHCWRCEAICTQQCSRCAMYSGVLLLEECQKQDKWRHQPECETAALKLQCSACDIEQEGLMKCTNNLKACYCSTECRRSDWKRHKTFCHDAVNETLKLAQRMKLLTTREISQLQTCSICRWMKGKSIPIHCLCCFKEKDWSKECFTYNCFVTWSLYPAGQLCFKWHLSLHIDQNRSASIHVIP